MELTQLIAQLDNPAVSGDTHLEIAAVTADSREVKEGMIYVAVKGTQVDGAKFIPDAIETGASVIVAETAPSDEKVVWVHVRDARKALSVLARGLQGDPSAELKLIGVTGTNGKTTTAFLTHHIAKTVHHRAGLMGTITVDDGVNQTTATHTTPDPVGLQQMLRDMVDNGCRTAAMEVSSHGIEQKRVEGLHFDAAVFTNLTQDHLDYHGTMDNYYAAKKALFTELAARPDNKAKAIINLDDSYGQRLVKDLDGSMPVLTFGFGVHCDFRASSIKQSVRGTEFQLQFKGKSFLVRTPMIGRFNIYNALAAIAAANAAGIRPRDAINALAEAPQVPGRLEMVGSKQGMSVFVDYAHTPDALKNVCMTIKELEPERLITVFGCGGDRDATKRPLMAEAAGRNSDLCFITSDNPRTENPESILKDIEKGMVGAKHFTLVDREAAIKAAVNMAQNGDVVLIAGKGHEDYQIFADETIPFDDRVKARLALQFKPAIEKPEQKRPRRDNDDRPRRDNDDRPRRDNDDRPRRDNDRPRRDNDRPRRDNDRPRRDNDRPRRDNDRPRRDNDRPRRDNDRPRRDNDRPRRDNDRPRRDNDRPRRDNDRPRRGDDRRKRDDK